MFSTSQKTNCIFLATFELLSANPLKVDQYNNLLFGKELTLSHTIPTFNDLETRSLLKTLWEKEKMPVTSIFSFSHNVLNPIKDKNQHYELHLHCRLQILLIWPNPKFCCLVKSKIIHICMYLFVYLRFFPLIR